MERPRVPGKKLLYGRLGAVHVDETFNIYGLSIEQECVWQPGDKRFDAYSFIHFILLQQSAVTSSSNSQ